MKVLEQITKSKHKRLTNIAMLSAVIGTVLLLLSIQLYWDWKKVSENQSSYIVINKPVNLIGGALGLKEVFSPKEIEDLEAQSFIRRVGAFTSNDFSVTLGSRRFGFQSDAFFESVPDAFVDIEHEGWDEYIAGGEIPIIMSADYLALYNFGFAPSQGLPQFTASTIGAFRMDVWIQGKNGQRASLKGRIIGFSKRLNSIIVPQSFLEYANQKYGSGKKSGASRLILEVDNPDNPALADFVKEHNYELNTSQAFGKQTTLIVHKAIAIILFIGFLVMLLTLLIFYLSYKLIVEERISDIQVLFTQGYTAKQIAQHFFKMFATRMIGAVALACILVQVIHIFIAKQLQDMSFEANWYLHPVTWVCFVLLAIGLFFGSRQIIVNNLKSKFK